MKKMLLLFSLFTFFLLGTANAQIDSVYLTADSGMGVIGDTIYMRHVGGGDVKIGINCYNETAIAGLTYPFVETCHWADLDSAKNNGGAIPICFAGGRVHQIGWGCMILNLMLWGPPPDGNWQFLLGGHYVIPKAALMPGDGYIAKMTFTIPDGSPDTCICLDTLFHPPTVVLAHCDTFGINEWTPHFTPKCFTIKRKPPVDSVYLTADSGVAVMGDTIYMHPLGGGDVKIGVNCHNETPLAAIAYPFIELCGVADLDLAKNNHSGETSIAFLGGRVDLLDWGHMFCCGNAYPPRFRMGATAMMAPPLMPGDGYIAKLTFTMPSGAEDTCICLDTLFFPPSMVLAHVDTLANGYTPEFTKKCFSIKRRPNTPPVITQPAEVTGYGAFEVSWEVSALDPEEDDVDCGISIMVINQTTGDTIQPPNTYVTATGCNPWTLTFNRYGLELGEYHIWVYVKDEHGAMDSCVTKAIWKPFFMITRIDTLDCVFPGQVAEVPVNFFGGVDIGGFKLYIEYDPTVMSFLGVERGALIDDFDGYYDEYNHVPRYFFQYLNHRMIPCAQQCETYKIKIVGIADMPDDWITGPLLAGEGELLKLIFKVANDANLQDLCLPVKFEFDYDFDLKAPSFSSASGESLYVDVDWPGELTGPNYGIFPIVTFVDGGVQVCSDAFCWAGDINMNEYPYEIADAVLFANYFIYGDGVFDIDYDIQVLATDVNQDGFVLSMSDFVFLIRIILEDISPKHKLVPSDDLVDVTLTTQGDAVKVISNSSTTIGAGLYLFRHTGEVKNLTMQTDMSVKYHDANGELRVLVYSFDGKAIPAGVTELFSFEAQNVELVQVEAVDFYGSPLKSTITSKVLPTRFALLNNYPNPFNLSTNISFALPQDSKVSLKLYNIAGQLVRSFEGAYHAGNHTIIWDGTNTRGETVASGIYFYKLVAGEYNCTKKMVLIK